MISIIPFKNCYTQEVIDLVLHFQNDGTRPLVTVDNQPDLLNIVDAYINVGGNFWVAIDNNRVVGSIGIMPCNEEVAILKKSLYMKSIRERRFTLDRNYMLRYYNLQRRKSLKHYCSIRRAI